MLNNMAGWDRLGMAWRGAAWFGTAGVVLIGRARRGEERLGKAGEERHDVVGTGLARKDKAGNAGMAGPGMEGQGLVWRGRTRRYKLCQQ